MRQVVRGGGVEFLSFVAGSDKSDDTHGPSSSHNVIGKAVTPTL